MMSILFFAEAVTLAHVARPVVLAKSLDPRRYDVHFACADRFELCFQDTAFKRWPINSVSSQRFIEALSRGQPLYDQRTLEQYIEDDLSVIDAVKPELIVGDFRISLAVSAAVRNIPYAALCNAHWSPYATIGYWPMPEHWLVSLLGPILARGLFNLVRPLTFAQHARPINNLRRKHGLSDIGDLRRVYTYGDFSLYADTPSLVPTRQLPPNHHYLGPILWSPDVPLPEWWESLSNKLPLVYVSLGSSGQTRVVPAIVEALSDLPVQLVVATAERIGMDYKANNIRAAAFLPGNTVAKRAQLVICSGGSAQVYQALAQGVPVLGLPSNLDQYLTMAFVEQAGAGISIRSDRAQPRTIKQATEQMLANSSTYGAAAFRVRQEFAEYDAEKNFNRFVEGFFTH